MVRPGRSAGWSAFSGGKDSYGLLALLLDLKWRGLLPVELIACNLDQGQPNFPKHILPDYLTGSGVEHRIEYRDTYSIVKEKIAGGQHLLLALFAAAARAISTASRARRAASSLVLGHHREDILETFFMNFFHGGRLASMPPKLLNDEGDLMVLRPLALLRRGRPGQVRRRRCSFRSFPATSAAPRTGCSATR